MFEDKDLIAMFGMFDVTGCGPLLPPHSPCALPAHLPCRLVYHQVRQNLAPAGVASLAKPGHPGLRAFLHRQGNPARVRPVSFAARNGRDSRRFIQWHSCVSTRVLRRSQRFLASCVRESPNGTPCGNLSIARRIRRLYLASAVPGRRLLLWGSARPDSSVALGRLTSRPSR